MSRGVIRAAWEAGVRERLREAKSDLEASPRALSRMLTLQMFFID